MSKTKLYNADHFLNKPDGEAWSEMEITAFERLFERRFGARARTILQEPDLGTDPKERITNALLLIKSGVMI